jgi:hypothetical protein
MTNAPRRLLGALLAGCLVAAFALPAAAPAQNAPRVPEHNLDAFETVDLPDPTEYRSADGRPGDEYWQQEADYEIDVTLDTTSNTVSGTQTITYTNNSPEDLDRLWVQLEQNYFQPGSRGAQIVPEDARFSGFFPGAGYDLARVEIRQDGEARTPDYTVDGTRMRIPLAEPLPADGGTLELVIEWSYTMPKYGADRHGRFQAAEGTVYEFAQWYPRMYVYDDVHGWNPLPYLGQGEYYLEFGTFEVDITVPRNMIVAATGELQNPDEVLTETQRERLDEARESRETTTIIGRDEVGTDATRPDGSGPLTWSYRAEKVRDFAWAASSAFVWDAARADAQTHTVLAQSFYPKEGIGQGEAPGWEKSTEFVQHSVEFYSETYAPYPYPNAINVAGIVAGMEYPQIVFCDVESRGQSLFGVTDHEFGHTWFPMVAASDERRWAWMDEGLNTFMNQYSTADYYGVSIQRVMRQVSNGIANRFMTSPYADQPIMTHSDKIRDDALGPLAYSKPALGLMMLREHVVGPKLFDEAFQAYYTRWKYKHPKPADFFRTIEDVTGENLDWFWRSWFYETDSLDQAVTNVAHNDSTTQITVEQQTDFMLPMTVALTYEDGSTETRRVPTEAFFTRDTHTITVSDHTVTKVQIDPNRILPDGDRADNTWNRSDASGSSSSGGSGGTSGDR